ncbi:ATP-dependent Clp protease proteolytic subunit [Methanococcus voltae]|uniref:ATP-dependent protease ClpP protease subunit n=2 Tax=Methanococcus voltae TaxID=2188 RepID=A0A8J7RGL8_METVO|nr:ATP-dependent Clp protease proteolytic subunit [Methanococcus voltae]MBP2171900.1 ATP-dependent protease ClpP protease subunit [Methanococcus voltae]MBP2201145.1 ATP-dependent protease ClpP protease subunit [Methanococcus voltae]MCS3921868.1 ATP-dependent protease ClpP protease subunit [Methanococcus voltae PS]
MKMNSVESNDREVVIRFMRAVDQNSVISLITAIDKEMNNGVDRFKLLISSPGGDVTAGLSAYNYLKGIPAYVTTHNFGSVDSIGIVIFCAGRERYASPQSRFLIHDVRSVFSSTSNLGEKDIEERLKSLKVDMENISKVISTNSNLEASQIQEFMLERTTLNPDEAVNMGLITEIRSELYSKRSKIISIH